MKYELNENGIDIKIAKWDAQRAKQVPQSQMYSAILAMSNVDRTAFLQATLKANMIRDNNPKT
jgi:hypothetical protein